MITVLPANIAHMHEIMFLYCPILKQNQICVCVYLWHMCALHLCVNEKVFVSGVSMFCLLECVILVIVLFGIV